jgi:hypothetical protein
MHAGLNSGESPGLPRRLLFMQAISEFLFQLRRPCPCAILSTTAAWRTPKASPGGLIPKKRGGLLVF